MPDDLLSLVASLRPTQIPIPVAQPVAPQPAPQQRPTSLPDLVMALRSSPVISPLLHAIAGPRVAQKMPGPGFIPGTVNLNPTLAPTVPEGAARPLAPGEWVQNPNGSWSNEISMTVSGDKSFNDGKPTVIPSLWIKDGKPYVAANEDEATELAKASGLEWPSFADQAAAEKFANQREAGWQWLSPQTARSVDPLYRSDQQDIEPPPAKPANGQ